MSNGQWLPLGQIGQLPAASSRRSVLHAASEKSLRFYHKAEMGVERREWERRGGWGRERETQRERGREREREQWRSKPVMAAGGWFPPSHPAVTHSPHTARSLPNLYTLSPSHTQIHIFIYTPTHTHENTHPHLVLLYSCLARTHTRAHTRTHTDTFHSFVSSCTHPCCFGPSFCASIRTFIKIFTGREAPWSSDQDTNAWAISQSCTEIFSWNKSFDPRIMRLISESERQVVESPPVVVVRGS